MKNIQTEKLVGISILTAIVVVLQYLGSFIRFGPFSISLVLIPIVVGAAMYGYKAGAWLGFVFGFIVLISGDAAPFWAITPIGTIITVLLKGTLAGACAGWIYMLFEQKNRYLAVVASAIVCPLVNTLVFLIGCFCFFLQALTEWAKEANFGTNVIAYIILGLVGLNFVIELLTNIILSPTVIRILDIIYKNKKQTA